MSASPTPALVGWGTLLRANRALISSLRDRAEHAEADQARRVAEARAAERARIAREMHDVLAHRLSLLATYAGALAYRPDAPPEQLSRAAEVIRSATHQALDELREVIGVLRGTTTGDPTAGGRPLPGCADLPRLIEESRAAGMRIEAGGRGVAGRRTALSAVLAVPDAGRAYRVPGGAGGADERAQARAGLGGPGDARRRARQRARRVDRQPGTRARVFAPAGAAPSRDRDGADRARRAARPGRRHARAPARRGGEFLLHAWLPWPE